MTKKEEIVVRAYEWAKQRGWTSVFNAYREPSRAKIEAEREIRERMAAVNGYGYYITGRGSFSFSAAWCFTDETGTYLMYETYANTFKIKIGE